MKPTLPPDNTCASVGCAVTCGRVGSWLHENALGAMTMNAWPSAMTGSLGDHAPFETVYVSYLPVPLLSSFTTSPSASGRPSRLLSSPPLAKAGDTTESPAGMDSDVFCHGVKPVSNTLKASPLLSSTAPSPGASVMPGWLHAPVNVLVSHLPVAGLNLASVLPLGTLGRISETRLPPLANGLEINDLPDGSVSVT